jgi:alcohol dehydrogenase class IV
VPTTAGTGSEATRVGVYTAGSGRKYTLGSPLLQADAALLSGALSASMPPSLTASTGFDALSHALESIWNKNATPLSLDASVRAALMVLAALEPAYDASVQAAAGARPESHNAIALAMLEAAAAAGVAFSTTGTALVHALSFVLSEDWHVPHGTACAFTLEDAYRLQYRDPEVARRLAELGLAALPGSRPDDAVQLLLERILVLKRKMGLPSTFAELGVKIEKKEIRPRFERAFEDPKMANSLPAARPEEIYAMLEGKA